MPHGTLSCSVVSDWGTAEAEDQSAPQTLWSLDESGWPIDEEGWPLVGELVPQSDGQLNFVKGGVKGKGKGKGFFNCGEEGHFARECPKAPKGKGKGKWGQAMLQLWQARASGQGLSQLTEGEMKREIGGIRR